MFICHILVIKVFIFNIPLVVEQSNYTTKIVNTFIVCYLDSWQTILLNNFKFKNCFLGRTNKIKISAKCKYVYLGYEIAFDRASSWTFGDLFA